MLLSLFLTVNLCQLNYDRVFYRQEQKQGQQSLRNEIQDLRKFKTPSQKFSSLQPHISVDTLNFSGVNPKYTRTCKLWNCLKFKTA